jgi:hypothetical protein
LDIFSLDIISSLDTLFAIYSKHSHAKRNKIAQWKRGVNVEYVGITQNKNVLKMNAGVA